MGDVQLDAVFRQQQGIAFGRLVYSVFDVGLSAIGIDQSFDATSLDGRLIAVEHIGGKSHHLAGLGHVAELSGQIF